MWRLALLATILWLSSIGYCQESFWCVQFFNKSVPHPLHLEIEEITPVGTVIRQFEVPEEDNLRIVLNEGDTYHLTYDNVKQSLIVNHQLRTRLNSVLTLKGVCTHNVKSYNYLFNLTVQFFVHVKEHSDPPQFINLPTVHEVPEKTKVDEEIFQIEAADLFDVNRSNITYKLLDISAKGSWANVDHMFFMDEQGKVFLKEKLDFDKGLRVFELDIEITDSDDPPQKNQSTLTIKVTDNDDQPPRFDHSEYHISLIGEKPVKNQQCHPVTPMMKAEDLDPVKKSPIKYKIVSGTPSNWDDYFRLEENNATLCQLKTLERSQPRSRSSDTNSFPTYALRVEAYQVDNPKRKHIAKLTVKINNQNIHAPTFSQKLYRAKLNEYPALKRRDNVIKVTATDDDYGINKQFRYEIIQNYKNGFSIDQTTGDIFVSKPIVVDREMQDNIELKIRAVETESEEKKESDPHARVILTVMDVNDNSPKFKKLFYDFEIKDTLGYNELVHPADDNLEAKDPDFAENGTVTYTITRVSRQDGRASFNDISRFKMDEEGNLRVGQSLRDLRRKGTFPEYRVTVRAEDQTEDPKLRRSSTAQVDLKVLEANDYPPIFESEYITVSVSEATAIGSRVTKLEATDKDGDEDLYLSYRITGGNADNTFSISKSGYLTTAKVLDREAEKQYTLTVAVSDAVHEAEATVEVNVDDVNDHAPEFVKSTFEFSLMENATEGEVFGSVTAVDEDTGINGQITYSLVGKGAEYFGIKTDGSIFVKRTGKLIDKEQNDNIILQVKAVDAGIPSSQDVAGISIEIVDVNDNAPVFSQSTYKGHIEEGQSSSIKKSQVQMEHQIEAKDADKTAKNRNIRYRLSGPGSDKFSLHPVTGVIRVNNPASIDCEIKCEYQLKIIAHDKKGKGLEGRADLLITVKDINDNAPTFDEEYIINIEPWTTVGTKIKTIKATDRDKTDQNNKIMYLLRSGGVGKFQLDFDTGDLTVIDKLTRQPELEEYILDIKAIDSGQPRLTANTKVTIRTTVNQQPIMQNKHRFDIPESLPVDSVIGKINATNPDDAKGLVQKLKYIIPDEYDVPFKVDADSGVVETKSKLDAETLDKYIFPIIVTDNGYPPGTVSTTLTINVMDVNDESPRFTYDTYHGSVVEDDNRPIRNQRVKLSKNLTVIDHDATNSNRQIRFSLKGPRSKLFRIDSNNGDIFVDRPGKIDRELNRQFKLKIVATDQNGKGLSTEANLIVQVDDVNDHDPRFVQALYEFVLPSIVEAGYEVGRLIAIDRDDTSPNNQLLYIFESDALGKFKIDVGTGVLTLLEGFFSKPRKTTYTFTVAAMDMGFPSRKTKASVIVNAPHMVYNDHAPKFEGRNVFILKEELPIGSLVGTLQVTDEDRKKNNSVNLIIDPADKRYVPFAIKNDGSIITTQRIDRDAGYEYFRFTVHATDTGAPPHNTSQEVGIIVDDINDNPPHFTMDTYQHMVSSNFPASTIIATPFAFDDVDKTDSVYQYSLLGGTPGYFYIDQQTGVIRTTDLARSLKSGKMEFKVVAQDLYNKKLAAEAKLNIQIIQNTKGRKSTCCRVPC